MFEKGIFGGLLDLNNDGKLDMLEQSLEFMVISELIKEDEASEDSIDDDFDF